MCCIQHPQRRKFLQTARPFKIRELEIYLYIKPPVQKSNPFQVLVHNQLRLQGTAMEFPTGASVAVLYFFALFFSISRSTESATVSGVDLEINQRLNITPSLLLDSAFSENIKRCARVRISGLSRLKLGSYSSAYRVSLVPSPEIGEKLHKKIQTCLHYNSSLGLCRCENDHWESIHNGTWSSNQSPYGDKYIDMKFVDNLSGSVTIGVKEEFYRWRLLCLFIGFALLLLAPIVSGWVPFYYSSSMAIGVCLVVIILLFQGMKLLPTGRRTAFYSAFYGLVVGAGSYLLNLFSKYINSILVNFGISEEMHNPVLVFIIVGIVITGAGFGYWLVRKFVVDEDGTVDVGVAQFVKWALRIIAVTFIFQSTFDTPLAVAVLVCFLGVYYSLTSINCHTGRRSARNTTDYYSTFHNTPNRKKYSEEGWKDFTEKSTREAIAGLASTPEFTDWVVKNADRIKYNANGSSYESVGSGSDSTEENLAESSSGRGVSWRRW